MQNIHENVLVSFRLGDHKMHDPQREPSFFGLIVSAHWGANRRLDEVTPELKKCGKCLKNVYFAFANAIFILAKVTEDNIKRFCHLKMTIRARWKTNMPTYDEGPMVVQVCQFDFFHYWIFYD